MRNIFVLLEEIKLNNHEKEIYNLFKQKQQNPLPLAEILLGKGYISEACELLAWGIKRFPKIAGIRVAYARELFKQGIIHDSWALLSDSPISLSDNLLANRILLQTAILLGHENTAIKIAQSLDINRQHNTITKELVTILKLQGLHQAKIYLLNDLRQQGIVPILPTNDLAFRQNNNSPINEPQKSSDDHLETLLSMLNDENDFDQFQVIPIGEIFNPNEQQIASIPAGMDTLTMAKIYEDQGHFSQALSVYRRLLNKSPGNEFLRNQVSKMAQKLTEQKRDDLLIDPEIVSKMEAIETLDKQIDTLESFLQVLN